MELETLGARLKSARKLRRRTLEDVAASIGVNKSTIQRYEVAKIANPKVPVIKAIAEYLEVNWRWLTGEEDSMEPVTAEMEDMLRILESRPELRTLLKTAKGSEPHEVQAVMDFFTALRRSE